MERKLSKGILERLQVMCGVKQPVGTQAQHIDQVKAIMASKGASNDFLSCMTYTDGRPDYVATNEKMLRLQYTPEQWAELSKSEVRHGTKE